MVVTIICGEWVSEEQERGNDKVGRPVLLQMRRKEMETISIQRKESTAYPKGKKAQHTQILVQNKLCIEEP